MDNSTEEGEFFTRTLVEYLESELLGIADKASDATMCHSVDDGEFFTRILEEFLESGQLDVQGHEHERRALAQDDGHMNRDEIGLGKPSDAELSLDAMLLNQFETPEGLEPEKKDETQDEGSKRHEETKAGQLRPKIELLCGSNGAGGSYFKVSAAEEDNCGDEWQIVTSMEASNNEDFMKIKYQSGSRMSWLNRLML